MLEFGLSTVKKINKSILKAEITSFYSEVDDWIIWQLTEKGYWSPSNLKKVENKGIEGAFSLSTSISKFRINGRLSYAYTETTNKKSKNNADNSHNKQLIYVPFHKLNYGLNIHYKTISINYNYNYTGQRFTTSDNDWYLPANFISNTSIAKQFKLSPKTSIITSFRVNNIFNQAYQPIAWRAIPGRNYLLSLKLNFN